MYRSGGTRPITWPRKIGSDNLFYILFHQKIVQKILDPSHLDILIVPPHHGSSRRPGTAPNSVNMGPKAPIIAYVVHLHHPRAQWPPIDAVMVRTEYYCDRNTRFVNFDRKILVASFFHHGDRAPQWCAWGGHIRTKYQPMDAQNRIYCADACIVRLCNARNWLNHSIGTKLWSPWALYPKSSLKSGSWLALLLIPQKLKNIESLQHFFKNVFSPSPQKWK